MFADAALLEKRNLEKPWDISNDNNETTIIEDILAQNRFPQNGFGITSFGIFSIYFFTTFDRLSIKICI